MINTHTAVAPGKYVTPPPSASTVHVIITTILGMIVTVLCCYTFYVFRTSSMREQSISDAMKVVRATTEIVASIAERGLPLLRGRLDELESRGRMLENHQKKTGTIVERLASGIPAAAPSDAATITEADMLAARRAARSSSAAAVTGSTAAALQ